MARRPSLDDPLAAIRRLLRDLKHAGRIETSPEVERLCPGVAVGQRHAATLGTIRIALYRLPKRQRELLRRYDLDGEPASEVQRALGLSSRQFFRDRHAALSAVSAQIFGPKEPARRAAPPVPAPRPSYGVVAEEGFVRRTLARNLYESGDPGCLDVLHDLATNIEQSTLRAKVFLDLADAARDYEDDRAVEYADSAAALLQSGRIVPESHDYLFGRLSRAFGRLADTRLEAAEHFARAVDALHHSLNEHPDAFEVRSALADALYDVARLNFAHGTMADAREASTEACSLIETSHAWPWSNGVEILAQHATLDACMSGRVGAAVGSVSALFVQAAEAGWCAVLGRLSANLVGLHTLRGDYAQAVSWYRRMASSLLERTRVPDRAHLMMEASQAYTFAGRAVDALALLGYRLQSNDPHEREWPECEAPCWHAKAASALERLGIPSAALAEAQTALAGFNAQGITRGTGDVHRILALCYAQLGDPRAAQEHILEAQRLVCGHGTPYALLRTLAAKAHIFQDAKVKDEARELARLLLALGADARSITNETAGPARLGAQQAPL